MSEVYLAVVVIASSVFFLVKWLSFVFPDITLYSWNFRSSFVLVLSS